MRLRDLGNKSLGKLIDCFSSNFSLHKIWNCSIHSTEARCPHYGIFTVIVLVLVWISSSPREQKFLAEWSTWCRSWTPFIRNNGRADPFSHYVCRWLSQYWDWISPPGSLYRQTWLCVWPICPPHLCRFAQLSPSLSQTTPYAAAGGGSPEFLEEGSEWGKPPDNVAELPCDATLLP